MRRHLKWTALLVGLMGFGLAVNGTEAEVVGAQIKGNRLTLMLDGGLKAGDQIAVSWPGGATTLVAR